MAHYRDPSTAPRDGTIIVGLFERKGKRAIAMLAAFDVDGAEPVTPSAPDAQWVHDVAAAHLTRLATTPTAFFRPLSDSDEAFECGAMIGWRPAPPLNRSQ